MEVDFTANILLELLETFTKLHNLKTLELYNTGLKTLPLVLFKMCLQLSTLGLHNTEFEGWDDFDERLYTKYQKQPDFWVVCFGKFEEGADKSL